MDLKSIQSALKEAGLDGWLFYDHHHRDPIAYRVLGIAPKMCTRRWYYFIPANEQPAKLVHRIEKQNLAGLPGVEFHYSSWQEQRDGLRRILDGMKLVAMQYSPLNDIPYVGLVDAGTIELVRSFGLEVGSSADLVQMFEACWTDRALASHLEAGKVVHAAIDQAFVMIREAVQAGKTITEYDVQQEMLKLFSARGVISDEPPTVAVNANTSNPHYSPGRENSLQVRRGDFVLMDVWGKMAAPGSVYFDVTWTGFVGQEESHSHAEIFEIVREARDSAVEFIRRAMRDARPIYGYEVDDLARGVIQRRGYADSFIHRTGHSIGEDVHGNGANIDNFETRDSRRILPGTCFSIEPGIYLPEFGVRSEINVYVEQHDARVTGPIQQSIVPILYGPH